MTPRNLTRGLAVGYGRSLPPAPASEETLVTDLRSGLTLAQMTESRFASLLGDMGLPVTPWSKFHPTVVGQIAQGVTRFEVPPLIAHESEAR
jgi:hypothetical protein